MAKLDVTNYFIYRWRYYIGYGFIGFLLTSVLFFAGLYIPGGLASQEMTAVIESQRLDYTNIETLATVNLPYHALQDGLLHLFGASTFTIKLASLLLAWFTALGLIALLRRWFRPSIAVLASLIAVTTGQFLYIAQLGTPDVLYVFWPIVILLLGTQITRRKRLRTLWKLLFGVSVALSLYTPLSIYMIIAVAVTIALHPHLRATLRRLSRGKIALSFAIVAVLLVPLGGALIKDPQLALQLAGIPTPFPDILATIQLLASQYLYFWQPSATTLMTPVFGLGSFLLICIGFYRLVRTIDTTRSYLIIIWLVCLTPALLLNPSNTTMTFLPSVLLLSAGLTSVISYWYRLFPRNPYARVAGLVPLIILVGALIGSGLTRYVYGYHYSPEAAGIFSQDLSLIPKNTEQLIVSTDEKPFYEAVANYKGSYRVLEPTESVTASTVVISKAAQTKPDGYSIENIVTSARAADADRWYVYTKQ